MKHHLSCLKGDTIKAIILVCLAVGVVGMSYGSLAMAYGFPVWVPFVLSITVLAGASEFMFIGIVASGGNPLAAAAAGLLVNARHVPFGVTVRELVGKRGLSLLGCHIMNDESVVFGLSQKTPEQRKAAYWLCGLGVAIVWPLGPCWAPWSASCCRTRKPSGWMRYSRPYCWRWWFPRLKTVPR
jgi:predicted branched-subunit amino acid permease